MAWLSLRQQLWKLLQLLHIKINDRLVVSDLQPPRKLREHIACLVDIDIENRFPGANPSCRFSTLGLWLNRGDRLPDQLISPGKRQIGTTSQIDGTKRRRGMLARGNRYLAILKHEPDVVVAPASQRHHDGCLVRNL